MIVVVEGPTAAGKTALACAVAERFPVELVSVDSALVYRGVDIGAAWIRTGRESQRDYVSLKIDDPTLAQAIYANLGRAAGQDDDSVYALIWNR